MAAFLNGYFLLLSIFSLMRPQFVASVCELQYPSNMETSPTYSKSLGRFTVHLPYNGNKFFLDDGETIQGHCSTNFILKNLRRLYSYDHYNNDEENTLFDITLKCINGQLFYNDYVVEGNLLECSKLNWNIYATNEPYEWCEKDENSKTFLLATKSSIGHHILASICFNINEWSLQAITYNVTLSGKNVGRDMRRDITKSRLNGDQSLGEEVRNLKTNYFDFTENDLRRQLEELSHTNSWLKLANYELSSIVQGESFKSYFSEFDDTLSIIWWHNLRIGNWKNFMNTLEHYASNNSFQIYAGASGAVRIPSQKSSETNILEIQDNYLNKTVPSYIWSYITSTDDQNDDFVILGYNSPFAEWFDINEIVFCPDICSNIPWLREIAPSFRYATAGVMFCCSPDFVRQTSHLNGFPMDVLLRRAAAPKQAEDYHQNSFSSNESEDTELIVTEESVTESNEMK